MSNTYTWKIEQLDCFPTQPQPNLVHTVHWSCTAYSPTIDSQTGQPYQAKTQGAQIINYDPKSTFKSFDSLTHDEVVQWVKQAMEQTLVYETGEVTMEEETPVVMSNHLADLYTHLDNLISAQMTPKTARLTPPWGTT